jgi:hypothetical protein
MILFIIIIIIVICLLFIATNKLHYWTKQNVFHVYDIFSHFASTGIMVHTLPPKTKYCNFKNIATFTVLSDLQYGQFVQFIRKCYLKNNENRFLPEIVHVMPYFQSHNSDCWFSFYYKPVSYINNKDDTVIEKKEIIASFTTRPMQMHFNRSTKYIPRTLTVHYGDYLCIDNKYRNQGIAQEMIETHSYNQQHISKTVHVGLFKREGNIHSGIVPLTLYKTYCFDMLHWNTPQPLPSYYSFLKCEKSNINIFYDFWKESIQKFDLSISAEVSNVCELIKDDTNIIIYMIKDCRNNTIIAAYFFRVSRTFISSRSQILTCFASVCNSSDTLLFVHGFKLCVTYICNKLREQLFQYLVVENISHSNKIINNLLEKNIPILISITAYYLVNFIHHTVKSENLIIIN